MPVINLGLVVLVLKHVVILITAEILTLNSSVLLWRSQSRFLKFVFVSGYHCLSCQNVNSNRLVPLRSSTIHFDSQVYWFVNSSSWTNLRKLFQSVFRFVCRSSKNRSKFSWSDAHLMLKIFIGPEFTVFCWRYVATVNHKYCGFINEVQIAISGALHPCFVYHILKIIGLRIEQSRHPPR